MKPGDKGSEWEIVIIGIAFVIVLCIISLKS